MWSRGEERGQQHQQQHVHVGRATEAVSLDRQQSTSTTQRQRYFIDGPARLTSALQLISSAIGASAANAAVAASPAPPRTPPPPSPNHHPHGALVLTAVSRSRSEERLTPVSAAAVTVESEVEFGNEDSLEGALSSMPFGSLCPSPGPRTIVAADGEVSNGFVKDGQRLPYVFEASDSGARKRTSKILPVCGVCGKRFVCVTTMKRHLVTHTGEKPFSCKVCGKQYTQKGNLRVHERTHRNDRPFECNICHQKFYRKEPMQKHQWRQHGVVHFKARPHPAGINTTGPPTAPLVLPENASADSPLAPPPVNTASAAAAANVLYNSIMDRIKFNSLETMCESSRHLDGSPEVMLPPPPPRQPPPTRPPSSPQSGPEDLSNHHRAEPADESEEPDDVGPAPEVGSHEMLPSGESSLHVPPPDRDLSSPLPTPLNAKLLTTLPPPPPPLPTELASTAAAVAADDDDDEHRPIKLKKLLAHAYQKEVEEAENQSHLQQQPPPHPAPLSLAPQDDFASSSEESSSSSYNYNNNNSSGCNNNSQSSPTAQQEVVECQCKACGHVFSVLDPYNFRCGNCNVKYTSLPTHMIADPLQCIGCCQVFPHKPALKSHQMGIGEGNGVASALGGERPFRCCKCGYGFRQKAHLQKHQWRIHRRKLEPDPAVKEAEALMLAVKGIPPAPQQQPPPPTLLNDGKIASITVQEIIDRGVERSMGRPFLPASSSSASSAPAPGGMQPLDLSPAKSITPGNRDEPKLTDLVAAMPPLGPSASGRPPPLMSSLPMLPPTPREPNPLFSQLPLQLPTEPVRIAAIEHPDSPPSSSTKRQRTLDAPPPSASSLSSSSSAATIHRSLPPITSLQRKPTTTATMTSNWAAVNRTHAPATKDLTRIHATDMAKKDLYIRSQLQHGLRTQQHEQSDVRTV